MLKTPLCDVLGIDVPIILAPMGTCTSAEFGGVPCPTKVDWGASDRYSEAPPP